MGIEALTHGDDGRLVEPRSDEDWHDWVSASRTRNHILGDPLLDWLNLYGRDRGFDLDTELPGYDPRCDFTEFIFRQAQRFEEAVVLHLRTVAPVMQIAGDHEDIRSLAKAQETFEAMRAGVHIIYQGVLWDAEHRTYGAPDLLVRADVLRQLFPDSIDEEEAAYPAPDLGGRPHYRIVDVKFTTASMDKHGHLSNGGSKDAYQVQLFIYNRALTRLQGYQASASYVLGRSWKKGKARGFSAMDRIAPVPNDGDLGASKPLLVDAANAACRWMRRVRTEGESWDVLPEPTVPELYPDAGNNQDGPWSAAKKRIATELEDLTLLWQVGVPKRALGHAAGIYRWTDPACTPGAVGVKGDYERILTKLMEINCSEDGPNIRPAQILAGRDDWHPAPPAEFYVDFETVSNLADDFSAFPEVGGQPLIFMIGCGHMEGGRWHFESFVVDAISEPEEARIIEAWLVHMEAVRARLDPSGQAPRVIHWSPAETSTFESAYNSAVERHPEANWPSPNWYDFLKHVVKAEPLVIRGAMAFGLKAVSKALHSHGAIKTLWEDGSMDGLGAMVGAWWCADEAAKQGVSMRDLELMQDILRYNEIDCRVMMEAVDYLRRTH